MLLQEGLCQVLDSKSSSVAPGSMKQQLQTQLQTGQQGRMRKVDSKPKGQCRHLWQDL